jgi:rhamnulokinase
MPPVLPRRSGRFAAVDIGGTSVRITVAECSAESVVVASTKRFYTPLLEGPEGLRLDVGRITDEVITVLRTEVGLTGVGVDSWSGDYGILGRGGHVPSPFSQREPRTVEAVQTVGALISEREIFRSSGVRALALGTIYQLETDRSEGRLAHASSILLLPDLITHHLTGVRSAEYTNASTTGLTQAGEQAWNSELIARLGLEAGLFPEIVPPGRYLGRVRRELAAGTAQVIAVASHDTASAVVAVPAAGESPTYISCGSWSLVGTITDAPVLSAAAFEAGFTNEAGLDGSNRLLHVASGLAILTRCLSAWGIPPDPQHPELRALLEKAAGLPTSSGVIDPADISLMLPGDVAGRIINAIGLTDSRQDRPAVVRAVLDSLAESFASRLDLLAAVTGYRAEEVHLVGGGAALDLLCSLTATASGRTVLAGPSEATTLGNLLVQARAAGLIDDDVRELRERVARLFPPRRFAP